MSNIDYDSNLVDKAALALFYLSLDADNRAWKGMNWTVSNRLYEKGWIEDPKNKNKSLVLTEEGREKCIELFKHLFGK